MFDCVIVMAGIGARANLGFNKALFNLDDLPLYMISVNKFLEIEECANIVLVCNQEDFDRVSYDVSRLPKVKVVLGGKRRQDSVLNGLLACKNENCLIHDAARPFTDTIDIKKIYEALESFDIVCLGTKLADTVKDIENKVTLNRNKLMTVSTPQGVKRDMEIDALNEFSDYDFLDDAEVFEKAYGIFPLIIESVNENKKITTFNDIPTDFRIGYGYDIHTIEKGDHLMLGGINIDSSLKFKAHSDGDVLIHSIIDAIFGAISSSDIGEHFSDSDPKIKGIDSANLLNECMREMSEKGYKVENVDCTIILEQPKLSPYKEEIKNNLVKLLGTNNVSIKAKTNEHVGEVGEGKACICHSIVLLRRRYVRRKKLYFND